MTPSQILDDRRLAADFVSRHWHRKALLLRGAVPGFDGIFSWSELRALAARDDVESRLVIREGRRWTMARGPFAPRTWRGLPRRQWTLLVQGTNLHDRRADALLRRFAFLPFARLDDLMVSYATPGGGVGPHVDDYDVFLLQGPGRRRWRYGRQQDHTLVERRPLKILARFAPQHDDVLAAGDMLYLPPGVAHDGVAIDACTTYSIGFRAAGATELAQAFLDHLRDHIDLRGRYADADLAATRTPARIDAQMQSRIAALLAKLRVDRGMVDAFAGSFLSEPKPDVFFTVPA
ncbi:MAG: cupin domain-containing protein, partial [Casimicrobiaceae bacterium]